jgi:hypothetical protein
MTDTRDDPPPKITLPSLTPEQEAYFRDLHERHVSYDPATIIGDPEAERKRLEAKAAPPSEKYENNTATNDPSVGFMPRNVDIPVSEPPSANDVAQAERVCISHCADFPYPVVKPLQDAIATALHAARQAGVREGREQAARHLEWLEEQPHTPEPSR